MSPTRFPLVAFGGPERFGSGIGSGYGRGLIDASEPVDVDVDMDVDVDVDGGVDDITKARKYREKVRKETGMKRGGGGWCSEDKHLYSDRRCLVGVRPLDDGDGPEGRMRRLLDGPAGRLPITFPGVDGDLGNGSGSGGGGIGGSVGVGNRDKWAGGRPVSWWETAVVTIVLCVMSLWFALKKVRSRSRGASAIKKGLVLHTEEGGRTKEDIGDAALLEPQTASGTGVESVSPAVEVETPRTPHSSLETPKQPHPSGDTNGTPDDGEDSEGEGDTNVTPSKRKARRGKRGRKKKTGLVLPGGDDRIDDGGMGSANPTSGIGSGVVPVAEGSPEIPPVSSLVINSPRPPLQTAPSLIVSDTILGKDYPPLECSAPNPNQVSARTAP